MRWLISGCLTICMLSFAQAEEGFTAKIEKKEPPKVKEESKDPPITEAQPTVPTGMIYMMSKDGLQVISPGAPKEMGRGEKILTRPIREETFPKGDHDPKQFGGIVFWGLKF